MCFSATASFVGSAVLAGIGVATMAEVKHRRELLFASVPCLFSLHQLAEGFVWLGLHQIIPASVAHGAGAAYILYAQGLIPFLLPLSVLLLEPTANRQRRMLGFSLLGATLALYTLWGLIAAPFEVFVRGHSLVYENPYTDSTTVAVLYVIATCGSLLFSGSPILVWVGVLNIIGLVTVTVIKSYAFTSLWCAYAAATSIMIYFFFRRSRPGRAGNYLPATS